MAIVRMRRRAEIGRRGAIVLACLCVALAGGCGHSKPADTADDAAGRLLLRLCDLHRQHSYKEMESLVEPSRAAALINTLMAMDRMLQANEQLQMAAEEHLGPTAAVVCDLRHLSDYLGPFSRSTLVVSTQVQGDSAVVVYQVGERVPVERAKLCRVQGQWRYMPDEPDEALPGLLAQLIDRMNSLRSQAESGAYGEQAFIEEFARQVVQPLQTHLQEVARQRQQKARAAATQP